MNSEQSTVRALAAEYRRAAGTAFARDDLPEAERMKAAAERLEKVAAELPPLPRATRGG